MPVVPAATPAAGVPGNAPLAIGRAMTAVPVIPGQDDDLEMVRKEAAAWGATPDQTQLQRAAQLRAKTVGQLGAEDYTLTNHGLPALPHIQRTDG